MDAQEAKLLMPSSKVERWVEMTNAVIKKRALDDNKTACVPNEILREWRELGFLKGGRENASINAHEPLIDRFWMHYRKLGFDIREITTPSAYPGVLVQIRWKD